MDKYSQVSFDEVMQPLSRVHDIDERCLAILRKEIERILAEAEARKASIQSKQVKQVNTDVGKA